MSSSLPIQQHVSRPTEVLMQEHRVIEQVLNCLEIIVQRGQTEASVDWKSVEQIIDFLRTFADRCHHGKEEDCLFPMLEQKGFSATQGPTGVMRTEHEIGRQHIRGMEAAATDSAAGGSLAIDGFVSHAQAYIQLLREHIQKEDHCLFQMADQTLSELEQSQLAEEFSKVEHHDLGEGTHQKYLAIATELANRFDVKSCASNPAQCGGCCSKD